MPESLEMVGSNPAFPQILLSNIKLIFSINEQIRQTKVQINEKSQSIPDYQLLRSIPGLGPTNATQILCEIGSINRFKNPKQFVKKKTAQKSILYYSITTSENVKENPKKLLLVR